MKNNKWCSKYLQNIIFFMIILHSYGFAQQDDNEPFTKASILWNTSFIGSFNGKMLATANDKDITILDPSNLKYLHQFKGHKSWINSLCFIKGDSLLASGGKDKTIKIWDLNKNKEIYTLDNLSSDVNFLSCNPSGTILASGLNNRMIQLWDISSKKEICSLKGGSGAVNSLCFLPDENMLLCGGKDNSLSLYDIKTRKVLKNLQKSGKAKYAKSIVVLAINSDSTILASTFNDNTINFWDVKTWEIVKTFQNSCAVKSVLFCSKSQFAIGDEYGNVSIYNLGDLKRIFSFDEHMMEVSTLFYDSTNSVLITGSSKERINFNLKNVVKENFKKYLNDNSREFSILFHNNSDVMLFSIQDTLKGFDYKNNIWFPSFKIGNLSSLYFNPKNHLIAKVTEDTIINLWDYEYGKNIKTMKTEMQRISFLSFSPDSKSIFCSGMNKSIQIWDLQNNKLKLSLGGHKSNVNYLAVNPSNTLLASCAWDRDIKLWSLVDSKEISSLKGHTDWLNYLLFSPGGNVLASYGRDLSIKLWDVKLNRLMFDLNEHSNSINSIVFNNNGKLLASISMDNSLILWDVEKGKKIYKFNGEFGSSNDILFSPDNKFLMASSGIYDGPAKIKIWDLASGSEIKSIDAHSDRINKLVLNKSGKVLLSFGKDKKLKFWEFSTGKLLAVMIFLGSSDWFIYTTDGYFDGSESAIKTIRDNQNSEMIKGKFQEKNRVVGLFSKYMDLN